MKKLQRFNILIILTGIVLVTCAFFVPISRISMKVNTQLLTNGKSISSLGEMYYQAGNGALVTRFITPVEYLVITNAVGDFSVYQFSDNSVTQSRGKDYSSENSFIYYFLKNKTFDMGLGASGFTLRNTRFENELVITTWNPPMELMNAISEVELVHENHKPIYMGFKNSGRKFIQKVYYYKYQQIGEYSLPTTITEIQYLPKGDSSITRRTYSDIKINEKVDPTWLNFRIPNNAKVLK